MLRKLSPSLALCLALPCALARAGEPEQRVSFPPEDLEYWALQPLERPAAPSIERDARESARKEESDKKRTPTSPRVRNPIDAFVFARLSEEGLAPSPPAGRRTLVRRLCFDLTGLPPSPEEVERFLEDRAPAAYERLVDRLLASPRYGERWGRHWLDLVRYADSDGFRADDYRPLAWKYRDYVVRAFNEDKPYDRFVVEQIAGDEAYPNDPDAIIATGYLRLWPYEHNQRDVHRQWNDILNDITDITGEVFLGLGFRCARCHDHKFDPILQKDYFALRSFFEAVLPDDGLVAASLAERARYEKELEAWLEATEDVRSKIEAIEGPVRKRLQQPAIDKFMPLYQKLLARPFESLSPADQQIHYLAMRQLIRESRHLEKKIEGEDRERWEELREELARFDDLEPEPLPPVMAVRDVGRTAPPTVIPGTEGRSVRPAFLTVLDDAPAKPAPVPDGVESTGRRLALARWLTRPSNPLSARVIVNRIWQHHFGRGLASTANDFGRQGEPPTHPGLLDWLACELIARDWSLKELHRLIVTSSAYRQSAVAAASSRAAADPENRLIARMPVRRLEAEAVRDAMLAASGELALEIGDPGGSEKEPRRSIYVRVMRNDRDGLINAFDAPDNFNSCARREVTTTAPQALLLLNGAWILERAEAFARRVERDLESDAERESDVEFDALAARAFEIALGRPPEAEELSIARSFLREARELAAGESSAVETTASTASDGGRGGIPAEEETAREARRRALVDLCHVLLNSNEFLYID